MAEPDEATHAARVLRRIVQALDLPPERLFGPADDEDGGSDIEQAAELLRLFGLIRDEQARRRCLAFVRQAARATVAPARGAA